MKNHPVRSRRGEEDLPREERAAWRTAQVATDPADVTASAVEMIVNRFIASIVVHIPHHTHHVIGSGANDPQKCDPDASRETLDHSLPRILAVALQDGRRYPRRLLRP